MLTFFWASERQCKEHVSCFGKKYLSEKEESPALQTNVVQRDATTKATHFRLKISVSKRFCVTADPRREDSKDPVFSVYGAVRGRMCLKAGVGFSSKS